MKMLRQCLLGLSVVALCGMAFAGEPEARTVAFKIEAQPVSNALKAFADQSGLQLLFHVEGTGISQEVKSPGVDGTLTPEAALQRLLSDTGLRYEFINPRTVTIRTAREVQRGGGPAAAAQSKVGDAVRFAQTEQGAAGSTNSSVQEQSAGSGNEKLEEIVVTAQKRKERLADVPISISVMKGSDLDCSLDRGVEGALNQIPGVITSNNSGDTRLGGTSEIIIRGAVPVGGGSSTAFYLDSIPFGVPGSPFFGSVSPDASAYDLEQVEVLRGPQGTLYGLSASNGVVRVLTKDATLDAFEFKARAGTSSTEHGGVNYRGDAAVNVPIVDGKLAIRGVIGYQDWSGWIDHPNRADANSSEMRNGRIKINARPTDELLVSAMAWLSRRKQNAGDMGLANFTQPSAEDTPGSENYDAYGLKAAYASPDFTITSMTSYLKYQLETGMDYIVIGVPDALTINNADASVFAEEVNVNSARPGPWRWTLGGIYRDADSASYTVRNHYSTGAIYTPRYLAPNFQKNYSKSFAFFGELTRGFFDGAVDLSGGLRYFRDTITAKELSNQSVVGGIPPGGLGYDKNSYDAVTPRAVVAWHPDKNGTVYASYGEGFSSGANQAFSSLQYLPGYPPVKPNLLKNYELGIKESLWGDRLSLESAAYYMDWRDIPAALSVLVDPASQFYVGAAVNAASASGPGIDFGATIELTREFRLSGSVSWNDLKVDENVYSPSPTEPILVLKKGDRLSGSPGLTIGGSADYEFGLGKGGTKGIVSISGSYIKKYAVTPNYTVSGNPYNDNVSQGRVGFTVESPRNWRASLFVDNVTDENPVAARDQFVPEWDARLRPRTFGLQVDYKY